MFAIVMGRKDDLVTQALECPRCATDFSHRLLNLLRPYVQLV